jgi:FlaA1/EpsC-like NDP-sugar epimerase
MENNLLNFWSNRKRIIVICCDILLIAFSYYFSFMIRFEMDIPSHFFLTMLTTLPLVILIRFGSFWYFGLYRGMWRFASIDDLLSIIKAISASSVLIILFLYLINQFLGYPRSIFFIDWLMLIILVGGFRFSIRLLKESSHVNNRDGKRVLIVGAGEAGEMILREMIRNKELKYNPIGLVDDDPSKIGSKIHGIKVLGDKTKIPAIVNQHGIHEIIISIPSASGSQIKSIIDQCVKTKANFKTLPSLSEIINDQVSINQIRNLDVEDILGREPVNIDINLIKEGICGKSVLVSGAGGSIGQELCRQIANLNPEILLLFEHGENSLFYIDKELKETFPRLRSIPLLADVTNKEQTRQILRQFRPDIIFHAAAHKHVPLIEMNPTEGIRNNVLGTKNIADAAIDSKADKFVFISTDKAVKPVNFMGVSKKLAEQYISGISQSNSVKFLSVRFGNVIGSTGSSFRIFREQINNGKPITITDPRATRYFMTVSEAVQLVLQAANFGQGSEIFILDMGKPINIYELAKTMIFLSGKEPGKDVEIVFTGLRLGEKLSEELFDDSCEKLVPTEHKKIYSVRKENACDFTVLVENIDELENIVSRLDKTQIVNKICEMVPDFRKNEHQRMLS